MSSGITRNILINRCERDSNRYGVIGCSGGGSIFGSGRGGSVVGRVDRVRSSRSRKRTIINGLLENYLVSLHS